MPAERISPLLKEPREVTPSGGSSCPAIRIAERDPFDGAAAARVQPHGPGDGVVGAAGTPGRPVFSYASGPDFAGGSLGEAHAATLRVMELAGRAQAPVIGFIASGGARMEYGVAALGRVRRIFRNNVRLSGRVPQISVICWRVGGRRLVLPWARPTSWS